MYFESGIDVSASCDLYYRDGKMGRLVWKSIYPPVLIDGTTAVFVGGTPHKHATALARTLLVARAGKVVADIKEPMIRRAAEAAGHPEVTKIAENYSVLE